MREAQRRTRGTWEDPEKSRQGIPTEVSCSLRRSKPEAEVVKLFCPFVGINGEHAIRTKTSDFSWLENRATCQSHKVREHVDDDPKKQWSVGGADLVLRQNSRLVVSFQKRHVERLTRHQWMFESCESRLGSEERSCAHLWGKWSRWQWSPKYTKRPHPLPRGSRECGTRNPFRRARRRSETGCSRWTEQTGRREIENSREMMMWASRGTPPNDGFPIIFLTTSSGNASENGESESLKNLWNVKGTLELQVFPLTITNNRGTGVCVWLLATRKAISATRNGEIDTERAFVCLKNCLEMIEVCIRNWRLGRRLAISRNEECCWQKRKHRGPVWGTYSVHHRLIWQWSNRIVRDVQTHCQHRKPEQLRFVLKYFLRKRAYLRRSEDVRREG